MNTETTNVVMIRVKKVKGKELPIDTGKIPARVWEAIVAKGLEHYANMGTSTKKGLSDEEYIHIFEEQVEKMYADKTRITGSKAVSTKKADSKVLAEAIRIAFEKVNSEIRAAGGKISHFPVKDRKEYARMYVERDPIYMEAAKENIARSEATQSKGKPSDNILSLLTPSAKLIQKAEEKKAAAKAETSAKQAGKVIPAKPKPGPHLRA